MRPWSRGIRWAIWVFACSLWLMVVSEARAGNPDLRWRTLETEHFYVHYYVGEELAADRVARVAERSYGNLSIAFGHRPFLKTHVVVTDVTDVANGSATSLPYPRMNIFVTAPAALSTLEAYDDWLDILVTHELVHVMHLDTVHGIPALVNAVLGFGVLGKVMAPNIVQPRWMIEGIATFEESDDTTGGRGSSAQFDMYVRMAVLEHLFQGIDRVSSGATIWPHGTVAYLYGLHFMTYIASQYGQDKLRELSHVYGGQLIPFGINRAMVRVLGVDFHRLWEEFERDTKLRFEAQARRIRARGVRAGRRLTFSGETARYPFWSADDREIYFYGDDGHWQGGIKRIPREGVRIREGVGIGSEGASVDGDMVVQVEDVAAGSWADEGELVFDMLGYHDLRYRWSDLYRWKGGDPRQAEQLTFGLRASEPHVARDRRTVAFRKNGVARSDLAFLDLETGAVEVAGPWAPVSQVYTPRWAPDGRRVAYSGWREGGFRDLYIYDRTTKEHHRITADRHMDLSPTWTPDGRYVVFSSDRDGVFNLYAYEVGSGVLRQVTNVLGGAFEPAISHDGKSVAYVGYSVRGYDLWLMDFDPAGFMPTMPAQSNHPPIADPTPALPGKPDHASSVAHSRRYRPIKTFFPRTIFPTALDFQASSFGTELGFEMGVADVVGFHSLVGRFSYLMPPVDEPVGSISYTYDRLFPTLFAGFARGYSVRRGYVRYIYDYDSLPPGVGGNYLVEGYRERATRFNFGLQLPIIRHPRYSVWTGMQYQFTHYTNVDADETFDPNAPASFLPEVGDVAQIDLNLTYSNQEGTRFGYRAESGRRIYLAISILDEHLGGDYGDLGLNGSFEQMVRMPWRGHQGLALRLAGGASAGGMRRRGAFFVGGFPDDQDVFRSLLSRSPFGVAGTLRGYQRGSYSGMYYAVLNTEYRIPVVDVSRGLGTVPVFFQRLVAIPYVDVGQAWTNPISFKDFKVGAGGSLVFTFRLGYLESIDLFVDYAHGFDDEQGRDVFRIIVARSF